METGKHLGKQWAARPVSGRCSRFPQAQGPTVVSG